MRSVYGGPPNPNIKPHELSFSDIKKIMPPDFVRQLRNVNFCGNAGDPMVAKDIIQILEYLKGCSYKTGITFHTNASGRSNEWWRKLGSILNRDWDSVRFKLDGLEDTHHIYRKGTNFNKIIESIKSFVSVGGNGVWDFIPFKHNQHQIDDAKLMAEKLGLKGFQIVKSGRFAEINRDSKKEALNWRNSHPSYSKNGKFQYAIEPADDNYSSRVRETSSHIERKTDFPDVIDTEYFANDHLLKFENIGESFPLVNPLDNVKIDCIAKKDRCIYICETGHLFPCCWTQYQLYQLIMSPEMKQMRNIVYEFGLDNIDLRKRSIKEIVDSGWLEQFKLKWELPSIRSGRPHTCSLHCSSFSNVADAYEIEETRFNSGENND
jgi:hypothetical protein